MKKVLSFVLVLSMILGSFGMAFAAPAADVVGTDYEDAVNVLTELGVVAGYTDGSYKPENIVTRAEMATFIIKAMGLADYAVGKSAFTDMAGHWADPFVAYAASLGFVAGNTDGTFKPDATVSYDQAITMLVQALGYKAEYLTGGYPGAFVNQAKTLGMLDGVKSGAAGANRGDVALLIFNTLDCGFVRYDKDGALQGIIIGNVTDTMMNRLAGNTVVVLTDVLEGNEDALVDMEGYQGAYADYYYDYDADEIVAVKEVKSVFLTGKMEDGKFVVGEAEYTTPAFIGYNTSVAAVKFLNGVKDMTATEPAIDNGTVTIGAKVSGKTIKEIYSIAKWDAEGEFQWAAADAKKLTKSDMIKSASFKLNDNEEIDLDNFVLVGVDALADIEEKDVVTYYVGGSYITKVEVSKATVEGKVSAEKADGTEVTINGKKYDVVGQAANLGDEGTFFLNYAGEIVAFEGVSESKDYAVITKVASEEAIGYDAEGTYKIKMLTEDDKEAVYTLTDDAYEAVSAAAVGSVISYSLNADGEVKTVTVETLTDAAMMSKKSLLDGKKLAADVVVFTSEAGATATEYSVAKVADVPVNTTLSATSYLLNSDGEVVVIFSTDAEAEDGIYGVVTGFENVYDEDDNTVTKVTVLVNGLEDSYTYDAASFTTTTAALYTFTFSGEEVTTMSAVGADASATVISVDAAYGIEYADDTYYELADDVVVYKWNADDSVYEAAELEDIAEDDTVQLFQVDTDDEDGFDIVFFTEA